jgi:protein-S-isoprenylcysteine O-methyltransferase Ste14
MEDQSNRKDPREPARVSRSKLRAITGSAGFVFFGGPTIVAGLVPWLLTRWDADPQPLALKILGGIVLAVGASLVLETTARFALQGRGTPAPWAPPERFVERGSYRFVRSPMYLGVLLLIVGQALLLGREILFAWAAVAWLIFELSLVVWEEPGLRRRFGADYEDYRQRVRRWIPTRPRSSRY